VFLYVELYLCCLNNKPFFNNFPFIPCIYAPDKFGAAMAIVKNDISGNITVSKSFCKISIVRLYHSKVIFHSFLLVNSWAADGGVNVVFQLSML
jgi:hypothetical protein